jgi:hypothetical protein
MDLRTNARLGLAVALCFVAVACAAPAIPDGTIDDGSGAATATKAPTKKPTTSSSDSSAAASDGTPTTTTTTPPASTTPPAATTPPPNTSACVGQAPDACFDCCNQASGGALAPADNIFGQCACGGGQCTAVCDLNFCSGTAPDATCSSCLQATCVPAEAAACTSTACKAGLACAQQCQ